MGQLVVELLWVLYCCCWCCSWWCSCVAKIIRIDATVSFLWGCHYRRYEQRIYCLLRFRCNMHTLLRES
jgi:hypothetical protein